MECPANLTCKYREAGRCTQDKPYTDTHHLYYPARSYKNGLEKRFRELEPNKVRLPRCIHDLIHIEFPIPEKPSREQMIQAIREELGERMLAGCMGGNNGKREVDRGRSLESPQLTERDTVSDLPT